MKHRTFRSILTALGVSIFSYTSVYAAPVFSAGPGVVGIEGTQQQSDSTPADKMIQSGPGWNGTPVQAGPSPVISDSFSGIAIPNQMIPSNNFLDNAISNPIVTIPSLWYTYFDMVNDIHELQGRFPGKISVTSIGKSLDGKDLYDIILGNPNAGKQVLLQGGMHAREHLVPFIIMKQLETILSSYDTAMFDGYSVSDMLNHVAVHIIPMSNPDGVTLAQYGLSGITSPLLQEKIQQCYNYDKSTGRTTRSLPEYLKVWKANANGVDLNHNFPHCWEKPDTTATAPSYSGFKGVTPLSEPENQALANMIQSRNWTATLSYHSFGDLIYWNSVGNAAASSSVSLANSLSSVTGYKLNETEGKAGFKDWVQAAGKAIPSVTLEIGSVSCPIPTSEVNKMYAANRAVLLQALKWAYLR